VGNVPKGLALKMFTCESFRSQLKQLAANVLSLFYAGGKHDVSFERVSRLSFLSEAHAPEVCQVNWADIQSQVVDFSLDKILMGLTSR
jgi:hypothetical protein